MSVDPGRRDAGVAPDASSRRGRGRSRAVGPVAQVSTGRVAEPTHRNPIWLLGGVLLVLASAVGGMLLFQAGDDRSEVLVAGRDLATGEVVDRDDFRVRLIAADGFDVVSPSEVDALLGQHVVGPVPAGALVHPAMFSAAQPIGPDEMDIGAALDPGAFPRSDLALGAAVELLVVTDGDAAPTSVTTTTVTAATSASGAGGTGLDAVTAIGRGTIVGVEERASGQLLVTVRVTRDIGLTAAHAAASGTLRLALVEQPVGDG